MIETWNRRQGRAANDSGQFTSAPPVDLPEAQPILARVGANICPFSPIDRIEHAKNITAVVLEARRRIGDR